MRKTLFVVLIFAFSAFSLIFADDEKDFYTLYKGDGVTTPLFDFRIKDYDLEFYDLMRGHLIVDCDISILQTTDGNVGFEKEFDMVKYYQTQYVVHPDDDRSYIGYQVVTDLLKSNPKLPDSSYYIDNYDIDIDLRDGLDKVLSVDVDYYTDDNGFKKPIGFDIDTRTLDDDFIIDITYDSTGITGHLVDVLDLIVIDSLAADITPPSQIWTHITRFRRAPKPKTSIYINDRLYMPVPRFVKAYAAPQAPLRLRGFARELKPPVVSVSVMEAMLTHYLLREVYNKAIESEKKGASVDVAVEVSPYVFNIWYSTHNFVFANYAAGLTTTARFKLVDTREFNFFLGVRTGYMYSFTSPVMFNMPMFGELGFTFGLFEIYGGVGGVYSGAYNANLIFAYEAGLGVNLPVSRHEKISIGINANLAKGYDSTDIKLIKLYSANISPYIGYKYSFSYFTDPSEGKYKDGYVTVQYEDDDEILNAIRDAKIQYIKLSEQEVKARGEAAKKEPLIVTVDDVLPALRILDFKAGYEFENKQEEYEDEKDMIVDPYTEEIDESAQL